MLKTIENSLIYDCGRSDRSCSKRLRRSGFVFVTSISIAILQGCGKENENPVVKEGAAFPKCPYTDVVYEPQQLIDAAVDDLIKRIPDCVQRYSSRKEFYSLNPHCCDIDLYKTYQGKSISDRRLAGLGYLIGGIQMHFYCASPRRDLGNYAMGLANVTSCARIIEPTVEAYEGDYVGRYPRTRGGVK